MFGYVLQKVVAIALYRFALSLCVVTVRFGWCIGLHIGMAEHRHEDEQNGDGDEQVFHRLEAETEKNISAISCVSVVIDYTVVVS